MRENDDKLNDVNGVGEFDPGYSPFKLSDIKNAIPKHCWVKNPWRSMSYVVRDVAVVLGFSNNPKLNSVTVHLLHSSTLVPYHGWRISHRTHHQNHGHVDNDESWHLKIQQYRLCNKEVKVRFSISLACIPILSGEYSIHQLDLSFIISRRNSMLTFSPRKSLFTPNEKKDVLTSTTCWSAMAAILVGCPLSWILCNFLSLMVFLMWWVLMLIFVMWLDLVTYLHHHGHDDKLPWYRGK
ncbi:Omega-3 fatty acid desaturase chloroplastic, partial [Bienertia sinuspersici]